MNLKNLEKAIIELESEGGIIDTIPLTKEQVEEIYKQEELHFVKHEYSMRYGLTNSLYNWFTGIRKDILVSLAEEYRSKPRKKIVKYLGKDVILEA